MGNFNDYRLTISAIPTVVAFATNMRKRKNDSARIYNDSVGCLQLSIFDVLEASPVMVDFQLIEGVVVSRSVIQTEPPLICRTCGSEKAPSMFDEVDGGWKVECKSCFLIESYRVDKHRKPAAPPIRPEDYDNVPLIAYEQNKPERYTITCVRCKNRRNPLKVAVVSAICESCWRPEEVLQMRDQHERWNRKSVGVPRGK